jgi:hypothetical protein
MINKELKRELLEKLKCTSQALSGRVSRLRRERPMSRENAYCLLAFKVGLNLDKYLESEQIEEIGGIYDKIFGKESLSRGKFPHSPKKKEEKMVSIKVDSGLISKVPLLSRHKVNEAKNMSGVFPMLYLLENSIRLFLILAFEKFYGDDWWDIAVPKDLKNRIEDKRKNEEKNLWHPKRGARNIDYLDFKELIILTNKVDEQLVKIGILPKRNWLRNIIEEVYESRCVLCHMNPLKDESIKLIEVHFTKWANQIGKTGQLLVS